NFTWSNNQTGPMATGLEQGSYGVTATDANGCTASIPNISISETPPVTLGIAELLHSLCDEGNGHITVSATGAPGPFTYTWSHNAGLNSPTASSLNSGTYTVTVTDGNNCSAQISATVLLRPRPVLAPPVVTLAACMGNTGSVQVSVQSGGTAPFNYSWSHNAGLNSGLASNLPTGSYTCTVTDFYGCTAEVTAFVGELPPPQATVSVTTALCSLPNGSAQVSASGGTAPYQYTWSNGAPNSPNAQNLAAGVYTVTVTDFYGCQDVESFSVGNIPGPSALNVSFQNSICTNSTGSITVAPQGGTAPFNYVWSHNAFLNLPTASLLPGGTYSVTATDVNGCVISATQIIQFQPSPVIQTLQQRNSLCANGNGLIEIAAIGTGPFSYTWTNGVSTGPLAQNLNVGGYTVTVTDANNCTSTRSFTIALEPAPAVQLLQTTNDICGQAIGAIRINAIGGAQPITFSWSHDPGLNSNWPTGLLAGSYGVTLTDANGCTATAQYTVGGTPGPTMQLQSVNTAFCGNAVGAVGVQATGGLMPYTYSWSHNPTLNSPTAGSLLPGAYSVTVTDANNCPATVQAVVPGTEPPVLSLVGISENPCVPNDAVIEATINGDHPPFQYAWSHNAGLNSLTAGGLSSGTYTITATDIHGCQSILSTSVTDLKSPEMAVENVTASRCNANDGSISVSVEFGLQPYVYTWSHNAGLNSGTASSLAPGQYTVTVTDASGCTDQVSANVTELPPPFVFVTATTSTCSLPNGSAQSFVSGGTAPYTYVWSSGSPNSPVAQNLPAGNYSLTVSDAFGCIGVQSFSVGDVPGPSELQVSFQNSICNNFNGAITVSPQGGTGPFHYNWSHNVFLNHPTATNLPAGTYSVTVTDATGCVISASQTILFQPPPTIETVQQLNSLCANGAGLIEIAVTGAGPFNYAWTNGVSTGPRAQNLNAGNYTVTVTDANGCTATRSFTIGLEPGPAILLISQTNDVCGQGIGSIRIRSSEGLAPLTFSWSHNPSLNSDWPTGLSAGHYSVTVTDANGCTATSQYTITETPGPALQVNNVQTAFCGNQVGSVNVQPLGGTAPYNYVWSHNAGLNSAFAGNLLPGTYSVTVTDANGCTATATATVGSTTSPVLTLIGTSENPCLEQDAAITFAIQGGAMPYTYAWSHNPALNSLSANGLASGTYAITATDANGCQASLSATVTDRRGPALQIESTIQSSCGFADGSASVSVSSGQAPYLFSWSHNSALSGNTAAGLAAGSYLVTVTDANGCTDVEQINISDSMGPQAVISQTNDAVCTPDNGSMSVSVQAGTTPYAYSWSHAPALNSPDAAGLAPGTYSVTITDANGCQAIASGNVGFQAPPVATAVVINAVCEPNTGSIEVSVSGGRSPYSIVWNTTALSGFNPAPVFAGSYSATITDANGCEAVLPVSVNFFAGPQVLLAEQQNASCQQSDGSIQIGEAGGTPPYAYAWSHDPNLDFFVANNLSAGTYTVTVTDANGCTATLTTTLTDIPSATLTLAATNSICGQSNGSVTANVIGGAWPLSFSWSHNATLNSPTASGLSAGSYSLTVTEANGCQSTATIQVSDAAGVSASVSNFANAVCDANTGSISIIASGGEGPYNYAWSHDAGLNAPNTTGLPAGIYTITVTDADGCRDVVAQTLSFTPGPQLALTTTTNTFCENGNGALSFFVSGGTSPMVFQWSHDVNLNAASAVGLNAGSYTITATDANGCTAVQTAQVGFIAGPQLSIASQTNTYCDNEAGAISLALSGGTGPMQFVWSHNADLNAAGASGLSAGTYSATTTDANGCTAAISVVITDIPGFTLPAPIVQQANCAQSDGAILLTPSGGQPPFQYQWSHDADLDGPSAGNLAAGLYQVTVTDAGGCVRNLTIEVQTTDGPAPAIAQLENASCGQANGSITTTLSGGQAPYSYLWSNGSTEPSVSGLSGGAYQLTVTDANGCIGVLSANIMQGAAPMLQLLNADPTGCTNAVGALQFGASGGQVPYTYAWSHNAGLNNASASGLTAGTYSVTLTDAAGCTATSGGEVRVQTDLSLSLVQTQNAICTSATGSAQVSGTGGQAPYSFVWSHDAGLHSGNANGLAAGSYSVTTTDGAGCTAELSFVVGVQNVTLQLSILQNSDTDCNQANGSIEMQTTGGQLPYSYNWSHAAGLNSSTANNLPAGSYSVTATDANGCMGVLATSISERDAPVVSIQTTNSWCDQATGTATVLEAGNFSYAWENATQPGIILSNNSTATGLPAGTYIVTVTNEQGCSTVQTADIQDLPDMLLNMASTPALCFEQANGMASVSVNGGTGPFQFVWDNGQTAANISSLRAGVYSVTATDANGCIAFGSVSVAQPAALSVNFLSSSQPSCEASVNGSLAVQVSGGTQPYDFQWDSGQQTANISGLGVGDYHLTVTDANGCQASFQVSLTAAGSLNIAVSTTAPTCAGLSNGAATVTTPGAFSYQWSVPGAGSSVGGLSPGTYFVTVSTADGCATVRSFEIPAASAIVLQTSSTPSCLNELNGTATATATGGAGGFSYSWSNMQSGAVASNLLPGIISVTATDANGCTQSEFVIIPGAPFPTLSVVNILPPDCSGQNPGAATVLATGGTGMIAYQWNDSQNQNGAEATNLSAGTYTVVATDENGCSSSISVELTPPADFLLAPGTVSHPRCFGETNGSAAAVVQGGSGNFSYLWNDPAAQTGPQATNLAAGTYTVSVTDNVSGCIQLITVQINHPALLQLAVVNTADVPCAGQNTGSAAVMASGGMGSYSYLWNDPAAQTGSQATSLAAGNYTVVVTDANGCTAQMPIVITEPPVLHAQLTSFTPPLCFGQNNGSATVSVTGGTGSYSYRWNDPAQQTSATAANLAPGNYSVSIRDANNCATTVSVNIPATPAIIVAVLAQSDPVCAGDSNGSLSVSATGGTGTLNYAWSNGQSGPNLSNLTAGNYTLSVTDGNGCIQEQAFDLMPAPEVTIQLTEAVPPICANVNTGRIGVTASGGAAPFSYLWSNGAAGAMIAQLAGGQSYQVTATNAAGCSQTFTVNLAGGAVVEAAGIPADTTLCADDVLELDLSDFLSSVVSGPGGFSDDAPTVFLETAGTYSIALESPAGCRDTFVLSLSYTANVLVAGMVLPSDVVVSDSVVILETSWPAPDTVLWSFDPTRVSIIKQEQNQYWFRFSEPGRYSIGMTARQGGCEDVILKDITVHADSSTIPSAYLGALKIVSASVNPNPSSGIFQVAVVLSGAEPVFVSLYNSNGVLVDRRRAEGLAQYSFDYDLRGQGGTYLVLVQTAQDRRTLVALVLE
ncbi:MAG: SprB repeat-containing protein, partial [Saprospiraceae bacterium]|nr:SprB repeat-containing protein [Saprospiraceae bacterium]